MSSIEKSEKGKNAMEKISPFGIEDARAFVGRSLWEARANNKGARCIDGRSKPGSPAVSMAGGDAGLLAIALAATNRLRSKASVVISDMDVLTSVFSTIGGKDQFQYHTDEHAEHSGGDGCGHCRLMKENPSVYGMSSDQADFFASTLREIRADGIEPVVLEGEHLERAVMLVQYVENLETKQPPNEENSQDAKVWVLDSHSEIDPEQAFVYQADLVVCRLKKLAHEMAATAQGGITESEILDVLEDVEQTQLAQTVSVLAPALPKFKVFVEVGTGAFEVASVE